MTDQPQADEPQNDQVIGVDTDGDTDLPSGTVVPPLLLCTLGLPLFLTIAWFFMRFTQADRFGGVVIPEGATIIRDTEE